MQTITYSQSLVLKILHADNSLKVSLNPDRVKKGADIYYTDNFGGLNLNDSIDVKVVAQVIGKKCVFTAIGANFGSSGNFHFKLIADNNPVLEINENLAAYSAKMWSAILVGP
jgi:hypothetical protein